MSPLHSLSSPRLIFYVSDRLAFGATSSAATSGKLLDTIRAAAQAGVDVIQIREKDLSAAEYLSLTQAALRQIDELRPANLAPPRVMVNDRMDVALTAGAGGVHLGENSLPVTEAKRLLRDFSLRHGHPHDFVIGVSCHSLPAAQAAQKDGADYIFFGPIFATPAKAPFGPPQGLHRLADVCRSVTLPVVAIGGISLQNAASCFSSGAAGIAAIRLFQDAPSIPGVVRALRQLPPV